MAPFGQKQWWHRPRNIPGTRSRAGNGRSLQNALPQFLPDTYAANFRYPACPNKRGTLVLASKIDRGNEARP
jgi:hypothetical protein